MVELLQAQRLEALQVQELPVTIVLYAQVQELHHLELRTGIEVAVSQPTAGVAILVIVTVVDLGVPHQAIATTAEAVHLLLPEVAAEHTIEVVALATRVDLQELPRDLQVGVADLLLIVPQDLLAVAQEVVQEADHLVGAVALQAAVVLQDLAEEGDNHLTKN